MALRQGFFRAQPHPIEQELSKIDQKKPWSAPSSLVNQYTKDRLFDTIKEIDAKIRAEGNDSRKAVLEGKLKAAGVHLMQKDIEQISEQGNTEIIKQFGDFLLGKSKFNIDPNYKTLVPWGQRKLYGSGIDDYLKGVLGKKIDFDTKIAMMRRSGYIPSDIEEAWFYFIFIVLQKQTPSDLYMKSWESFYPAPLTPPHMYDIDTKLTRDAQGGLIAKSELDAQTPEKQNFDAESGYKIDPKPQLTARYIGNQDGTDVTVQPFDQKVDSSDPTKDISFTPNKSDYLTGEGDLLGKQITPPKEDDPLESKAKSQTEALTELTLQMKELISLLTPRQEVSQEEEEEINPPRAVPPKANAMNPSKRAHTPAVTKLLMTTPVVRPNPTIADVKNTGLPPSQSEKDAHAQIMTTEEREERRKQKEEETEVINAGGDTTDVGQRFVIKKEDEDKTDPIAKKVSFMAHGTPVTFTAGGKSPDYYEIKMASIYQSRKLTPEEKQRRISRYAKDNFSPSVRASANKYLANLL